MRQILPFQSTYNVVMAKNVNLDAWHGARDFAQSDDFNTYLTTKHDYDEFGSEYFREHYASNQYFPTPAPIVVPIAENQNAADDKNKLTKMEEEIFIE